MENSTIVPPAPIPSPKKRNRSVAVARDAIPYIKGYRQIAGTVTATILFQQLEYWFDFKPNGFYKFLEPCDNGLYKAGDSWCEELSFSPDEFRSAFDKIGKRYFSKKAYDGAADKFADDSGSEKLYCSYQDKIKGLTYYRRNHSLVEKLLNEVDSGDLASVSVGNSRYSSFLNSEYWRQVKTKILDRDNRTCQECGSQESLHVHHLTYEHQGQELDYLDDLKTVCSSCHRKIHNLNPGLTSNSIVKFIAE